MHTQEPGPVLTDQIIRLGIKVHRRLGPGLLEAVYCHCLCWELHHANLEFKREAPLAVVYEAPERRLFRRHHRGADGSRGTQVGRAHPASARSANAHISPPERLFGCPAHEFQHRPAERRLAALHPMNVSAAAGLGQQHLPRGRARGHGWIHGVDAPGQRTPLRRQLPDDLVEALDQYTPPEVWTPMGCSI